MIGGGTIDKAVRQALACLTAMVLGGGLNGLGAGDASAGVMTQVFCSDAQGRATSTSGWSQTNGGGWRGGTSQGSVWTCTAEDSSFGMTIGNDFITAVTYRLNWTYTAPANTRIDAFALNERYRIDWPVGGYGNPNYGNVYAFRSWHDEWALANFFETPLPDYRGVNDSGWHTLSASKVDYGSLSFQIECAEINNPAGGDCMQGTSFWSLSGGTISLRDDSAPIISQVSGSLTREGEKAGTATIAFNASDTGVGVYRAIYRVDGQVVSTEILDDNEGRCAPRGSTYTFGWAVPCKLALSDTSTFDTTALADGTHDVQVIVEDAAGNAAIAWSDMITTDNEAALAGQGNTASLDGGGTKQDLKIKLKISPRRTFNKRKIHWRGRIVGGSLPRGGVTVLAQVRQGNGWTVFKQIRVNKKNQFKFKYRFHATTVATTYTFRVALTRIADHSIKQVNSNTVKVRVKP